MSYSFSVLADTKDEAKQKVAEQFDAIVASQPVHEADRSAAQTAINAFIDVVAEPTEAQAVSVAAYGSLSWREEGQFYGANGSATVNLTTKTSA